MNDYINVLQSNRLPYWSIIALVFIGFLLIIPVSSAETLKVISNTDICKYQPNINKDYCKTVYELCDPSLDMKKVDFRFKIEKDNTLMSQIDDLSYNYSSKIGKTNCRLITVEGYKNPYKNIDNVLCYNSKCHEEYIWWNTSFTSKFPIFGNISTGNLTFAILVNDSCLTIDGTEQCVWCNYTLNTTRQILGYFYFRNITMYRCIDRSETFEVEMQVESGNGSDFGNPFEKDITLLVHFNDSVDSSIYQFAVTENSFENDERVAGKIGFGNFYDGDYLSVANHPSIPQEMSISFWANIPAGSLSETVRITSKYSAYVFPNLDYYIRMNEFGANGLWLIGDSGPGNSHQLFFDKDNLTGDVWDHWVFVANGSDFMRIYKNGSLIAQKSIATGFDTGTTTLYIGLENVVSDDVTIDEFRFYNRTLSADEISALFQNQVGDFNLTHQGDIINLTQNISVRHFDFNATSFPVTSQQYQTVINDTFTLVNPIELIIKGSGGVNKINGGGATSLISARLIFNGVTLYDQTIRSVRGTSDRGSFAFPLVNATGQGGTNRFILQMRRTGIDDINISDLSIHVDTSLSSNNINIPIELETVIVNYTSTVFLNIANYTIDKDTNSTVLIDVNHIFESTSNNIVGECFLENNQTGERTLTYSRWLQFIGNVGNSGINHRSRDSVHGPETWLLFCRSSSNNMILNNITVFIMNQQNIDNHTIRGFQNDTSISGLSGSGNIILSSDYSNAIGPQLEIITTIIMQSVTGSQDGSDSPLFTVRTNDSVCNAKVERSLASNSDIGTVKIYLDCGGLTPGITNNYQVLVDVSIGNTLNILNASISTYETTPQLVIEGIVPPIVRIIIPANGSTITETINIQADITDLSRTGWRSFIEIINASGIVELVLLNETSFENTTSIPFNTRVLDNGNYSILWAVFNDQGNNSDNVTVAIINIVIPAPPTISFCLNGDLLLSRESTRTTTNGNVTIEVIDTITFCHYGCFNATLSNLGNPGCIESDLVLSLVLIAVVLISVLSIRRIL